MIDIIGVYNSLLNASLGGVVINVIDSRHAEGRRVQKVLFPGIDQAAFIDTGQLDGPITMTCLLEGDDYTHQADRLKKVLTAKGPQTLVHPWLGTLQVILAKECEITFSDQEYRIARFTLQLERYRPWQPPATDTLQGLLDALDDLKTQAENLLAQVLAPVALVLSLVGQVESFCSRVAGVWDQIVGTDATCAAASSAPIGALDQVNEFPIGSAYAGDVGAALSAVSAALVAAGTVTPPAAVAPGGSLTAPASVDPSIPAVMIMTAVPLILATPGPPGLPIIAAALAFADACTASSDIVFASQQDANGWLADLLTLQTQLVAAAAVLLPTYPIQAGPAWRALQDVSSALIADYSSIIGRLPAVTTITPPAPCSVWQIAQYLSGDNPANVVATYLDLVSRNAIWNPALAPAAALEVLL